MSCLSMSVIARVSSRAAPIVPQPKPVVAKKGMGARSGSSLAHDDDLDLQFSISLGRGDDDHGLARDPTDDMDPFA
jgi:hypothetical protein